jgi:hypothetical protein
MVKWYTNHRNDGLVALSGYLLRYSAIILKARADINELMGKLVEALEKWYVTVTADLGETLKFFVSLFRKAVEFALAPEITAANVALAFYDVGSDMLGAIPKGDTDKEKTPFKYDSSDLATGIYNFLKSYISAGNRVLEDAADAVDALVDDREYGMVSVRNNWVGVPAW